MRRKRNDVTINLRKSLRDEQLSKRRNLDTINIIDDDEIVSFTNDNEMTIDEIKQGTIYNNNEITNAL